MKINFYRITALFAIILVLVSCGAADRNAWRNNNSFTVSGTVSGLTGTGLVLQNNNADDNTVTANGSFTFTTTIVTGLNYAVTVKTQPNTPTQTCYVNNGSGTMGSANVTNVNIICALPFLPLSGAVGTLVTLVGTDLTATQSVSIGGKAAIVVNSSTNMLTAMVMPEAVTGAVSVTTAAGTTTIPGIFTVSATGIPAKQQGSKLVGSGAVSAAQQGISVAVSADGNTAVVGGPYDNSFAGAAWVYTRSGVTWTQQGNKLVGNDTISATGKAVYQGISVAVSADGNTAVLGGYGDNSNVGAAWVYTRSSGQWSQQGGKLVGVTTTGPAYQGISVAVSADGNTAVVGGYGDNSYAGAAWVYIRSGGIWTPQGNKLVGNDVTGTIPVSQGISVAVNADGNTVVVGGYGDNSSAGAAWVYTRSSGQWSQQGGKLVGATTTAAANQGSSVAVSADGNTAIVGGILDSSSTGAAWVYARSSGIWAPKGSKLVGTGVNGTTVYQGHSVAMSADGSTAVVGGFYDASGVGAAWVYIP
ncbi:MAG: beta strand repeat-containing protein [Gallionellaceae bacterium]